MTIETLSAVLGWSAIINYIVLLVWFLVFACWHDFIYNLHSRWFNLRLETFDAMHYISMALFKLGILLFNLVPWLALRVIA